MRAMTTSTTDRHDVPTWTIGDRLAKAREHAGLTQQAMADAMRIGRRSVVRYEQRTDPPRAVVLAYSKVTGVPVWWIEGRDEPSTGDGGARSTIWDTAPRPSTFPHDHSMLAAA